MAKGLLAIVGVPKKETEDDEEKKPSAKEKAVKAFAAAMRTQDWEAASKALDLYLGLNQ